MRLLRLLEKVGLPVLAVWTVVRWLLDFYGRIQSAKDFFENRSLLIKWAGLVLTSQWLPLVLFLLGVAVLVLAPVWRARKRKNELIKPKEPQPAIVAIDELKTLLYEGERLVGRFQEDSVKPSFEEVENWRKRTCDCARQNTLASLVTAKDLLRLEKPWEQGEVIRITARFLDHGCFAYGSVEMAVFEHLWGRVERLKQLIAKIGGEQSSAEKELPRPHLPIPVPTKTPIEEIDEVLEKGEALERTFASVRDPLPANQSNMWVEETRTILRTRIPNYVDRFNEAVTNPQRFNTFPNTPNRSIEEFGEWTQDKNRRAGWDVINSALCYLKQVRKSLYSKLPA